MESLEVTGRTVNEAIEKALRQLGKPREDVDVAVLSEGSRGGRRHPDRPARRYPGCAPIPGHPDGLAISRQVVESAGRRERLPGPARFLAANPRVKDGPAGSADSPAGSPRANAAERAAN